MDRGLAAPLDFQLIGNMFKVMLSSPLHCQAELSFYEMAASDWQLHPEQFKLTMIKAKLARRKKYAFWQGLAK